MSDTISHSHLVSGLRLPGLGYAARFALWSFRALAAGHNRCPVLVKGYENTFGQEAEQTYLVLEELVFNLAKCGRRRIRIGLPGCLGVAVDELSIIGALHAAQTEQADRLKAHLCWLTAQAKTHITYTPAVTYGRLLKDHDLHISSPERIVSALNEGTDYAHISMSTREHGNVRTLA